MDSILIPGLKILTPIVSTMIGASLYLKIYSFLTQYPLSARFGIFKLFSLKTHPLFVGGISGFALGCIGISILTHGWGYADMGNLLAIIGSFVGFVTPLIGSRHDDKDITVLKSMICTVIGALTGTTIRLIGNMFI